MRRPPSPALTVDASGGMSMPFLPTLATVIVLAAASVFCPTLESAPPAPPAAPLESAVSTEAAAAPGPTAFAAPAPFAATARLPASLAFAEAYPLSLAPVPSVSVAAHMAPVSTTGALRAGPAARGAQHLATAVRKPCAGKRCTEIPPHATGPLAAVRREDDVRVDATEEAEGGFLPPMALPFASVAETLAPAARIVGAAAGLLRGGATSVKGSVAVLADCLP